MNCWKKARHVKKLQRHSVPFSPASLPACLPACLHLHVRLPGRNIFFIFNLFFKFYFKNNLSGQIFTDLTLLVAPVRANKTRCRATCISVTRCATLARFGVLERGLPAYIPCVNLVTPLTPA
jgi:hypothetical protein